VNKRCQEETVQAREVRDREQEEACAAPVWELVAAVAQEEVWELAPAAWAEWAERAREQDQEDNAFARRAALQRLTR
jgi:hypothetical protein